MHIGGRPSPNGKTRQSSQKLPAHCRHAPADTDEGCLVHPLLMD